MRQVSQKAFVGISALLFIVSAAMTITWCGSMSTMDGMPMPGGWSMSMTWMRMPDQTWPGAVASFMGMWAVMMVAMMLPSLTPMLRHLPGASAVAAGVGYFAVWTALGLVTFPLGVALTTLEMHSQEVSRVVPFATGLVVLLAGALQFTRWKAHQLACCSPRPSEGHSCYQPPPTVPHACCRPLTAADAPAATAKVSTPIAPALRYGLHLGVRCTICCAGLTAILLVTGVMDLAVMACVTAAITAERIAPANFAQPVAHAIGAAVTTTGLVLIARGLTL